MAYIPEASLLPEWLLKRQGFWDAEKACGKLSGKNGNRVKAVRLRGELSQGICYPAVRVSADTGQNATGYEYTDGKTTLTAEHIREGVVMVPAVERYDPTIGRVCLKSVSADYLTRKGGTEFN